MLSHRTSYITTFKETALVKARFVCTGAMHSVVDAQLPLTAFCCHFGVSVKNIGYLRHRGSFVPLCPVAERTKGTLDKELKSVQSTSLCFFNNNHFQVSSLWWILLQSSPLGKLPTNQHSVSSLRGQLTVGFVENYTQTCLRSLCIGRVPAILHADTLLSNCFQSCLKHFRTKAFRKTGESEPQRCLKPSATSSSSAWLIWVHLPNRDAGN